MNVRGLRACLLAVAVVAVTLTSSSHPAIASAGGNPTVAGDARGRDVPAPVYVRWAGRGFSYDDVRVACCSYSEMADVMVSSPRCRRPPHDAPADGRCHGERGPDLRRLRLHISWSDGRTEVIHVRTPRHVFIEAPPFRARDVRWNGRPDPQQRVIVHEQWAGSGWVPLGQAVRDVRFSSDWPEEAHDGT